MKASGSAGSGIKVIAEDRLLTFDQAPVNISGRVMVPLRVIFEELGAVVTWDRATQRITVQKEQNTLTLTIGSSQATTHGTAITILDQPPIIIGGRVMVPLRFVSEATGAQVVWEAATRTVYISLLVDSTFPATTPNSKPATTPTDAASYYELGTKLSNQRQFAQAIDSLNKAIELNPKLAEAFEARGQVYNALQEYDKAVTDFGKAIELKPLEKYLYYNQAYAYSELTQYDLALVALNKVIQIYPRDNVAYNHRGLVYRMLGQYDQAAADYTKSIAIEPQEADAYYYRGYVYELAGQYDQALADYGIALALNPDDEENLYFARGRVYKALQQYAKAIEEFTVALKNSSSISSYITDHETGMAKEVVLITNREAYYERAFCYEQLGQIDLAKADLEKALKMDSNYEEAKSALERLRK